MYSSSFLPGRQSPSETMGGLQYRGLSSRSRDKEVSVLCLGSSEDLRPLLYVAQKLGGWDSTVWEWGP